ncbi:MAG TPA: hypothetical protein VF578_17860, partial [Methylomirabilota bacterium]
ARVVGPVRAVVPVRAVGPVRAVVRARVVVRALAGGPVREAVVRALLAQAVRVQPAAPVPEQVLGLVAAQVRALADPAAAQERLVLPGEQRVDRVPRALQVPRALAAEPLRRDRRPVRRGHRPP